MAAFSIAQDRIPQGWRLGIQVFDNHIEPVLIPVDLNRHEVWNLVSNKISDRRRGAIYAPARALATTLVREGVLRNVSRDLWKIADPDPIQQGDLLVGPGPAPQNDSGGDWPDVGRIYQPGIENPEARLSARPEGGIPRRETGAAATFEPSLNSENSRGARPLEPWMENIQDPILREFARHTLYPEWIRDMPGVTREQLIQRLDHNVDVGLNKLNRDGGFFSYAGPDRLRGIVENYCTEMLKLQGDCRGNRSLAQAVRSWEIQLKRISSSDEALVGAILNAEKEGEILEGLMSLMNEGIQSDDPRYLRLLREQDRWTRNRIGLDPHQLGTLSELFQYWANPSIRRRVSLAKTANERGGLPSLIFQRMIREGLIEPDLDEDDQNESRSEGYTSRTVSSRERTEVSPFEIRDARYLVSRRTYQDWVLEFLARSPEVDRERRIEMMRRVIDTFPLVTESSNHLPANTNIVVCGNRIASGHRFVLLQIARMMNADSPEIFCPRNSTSPLTPHLEYQLLDESTNSRP
jgi:hypothetical protein